MLSSDGVASRLDFSHSDLKRLGIHTFAASGRFVSVLTVLDDPRLALVVETSRAPIRHDRQSLVALAREIGFAHLGVRLVEQRTARRYEALVENSADIVGVLTDEGLIAYVSPAVERTLGF